MSALATFVTDVVALLAMGAAFLATPERLDATRGGPPSGTRRSLLPPPGRRVPSRLAVTARWRLGRAAPSSVPRSARWAGRHDLRRLLLPSNADSTSRVSTATGRLVLGRAGRRLVAAEARQSVVVFGPTQSGKTGSLAVPAILGWEGPVLATSVKTDLVDHTARHRQTVGQVEVFDPARRDRL